MVAVATGNAFDGLALYGPFVDSEAANEWAERFTNVEWVVVGFIEPEPEYGVVIGLLHEDAQAMSGDLGRACEKLASQTNDDVSQGLASDLGVILNVVDEALGVHAKQPVSPSGPETDRGGLIGQQPY